MSARRYSLMCALCEKPYVARNTLSKYCSPRCTWTAANLRRKLVPRFRWDVTCKTCGRVVECILGLNKRDRQYCSLACSPSRVKRVAHLRGRRCRCCAAPLDTRVRLGLCARCKQLFDNRKQRDGLSAGYVHTTMPELKGIKLSEVPTALIEAKRNHIRLRREIKRRLS